LPLVGSDFFGFAPRKYWNVLTGNEFALSEALPMECARRRF
jgi:hypothetical protein